MTTLLECLQEGPPSRKLSDRVLLSWGWLRQPAHKNAYCDGYKWYSPGTTGRFVLLRPSPTESVDDALAGVPEGWWSNLASPNGFEPYMNWQFHLQEPGDNSPVFHGEAPTPALAICAAIVKALHG